MQNQRQKIGQIGENIAINYLKKNGYQILARNFRTKWGELDIVALPPHQKKLWCGGEKNKVVIFVEVKTLRLAPLAQDKPLKNSDFLPEDEITFHKAQQLRKMAQIYLSNNKLQLDTPHQIDILAIELAENQQTANIRHLENAIEDY